MIHNVEIGEFMELAGDIPVFDVRSPGEFLRGHIPGALNLPLFDDGERSAVGTLYKQSGREAAVLRGLGYAGKKLTAIVKEAKKSAPGHKALMHCWRGGMRSESMGWLLSVADFDIYILKGGYKSYRNHIRRGWEDGHRILVLSGKTGSGKTEILRCLQQTDQQVLDLEYHARHKGSAFGSLGELHQPTSEQFENDLAESWLKFNPSQILWIEDESQSIGNVRIPDGLFNKIRNSGVIAIDMAKELRTGRLVRDYSLFPRAMLIRSVEKIERRLGGQNAKAAIEAIENDDFRTAAGLLLDYYDKTYTYGLEKRDTEKVITLVTDTPDPLANAKIILNLCKRKNII